MKRALFVGVVLLLLAGFVGLVIRQQNTSTNNFVPVESVDSNKQTTAKEDRKYSDVGAEARKRVTSVLSLPRNAAFASLRAEDAAVVVEHFNAQTNINAQAPAMWAMARFSGNEAVAQALIDNLMAPRWGYPMSQDEEELLRSHLIVLGYLAGESEVSWSFLKKSVYPQFWREHMPWKSPDPHDLAPSKFAGRAISAIGRSGREEARLFLEDFKWFPLEDESHANEQKPTNISAVMDAVFWLYYRERNGYDAAVDLFYRSSSDGSDYVNAYYEWQKSEAASRWVDWQLNRRQSAGLPISR